MCSDFAFFERKLSESFPEDVQLLYRILFINEAQPAYTAKYRIEEWDGFDFEEYSDEYLIRVKIIETAEFDDLKRTCLILGIPRESDKRQLAIEIITKLYEFGISKKEYSSKLLGIDTTLCVDKKSSYNNWTLSSKSNRRLKQLVLLEARAKLAELEEKRILMEKQTIERERKMLYLQTDVEDMSKDLISLDQETPSYPENVKNLMENISQIKWEGIPHPI